MSNTQQVLTTKILEHSVFYVLSFCEFYGLINGM